jgi:hypothetical protein
LFAKHFCRKNSEERTLWEFGSYWEKCSKNIASKKKKSSEKEKVDIDGKKEEKFSDSKSKANENFSAGQSSPKMKENIEKEINKVLKIMQRKQKKKKVIKRKIWIYLWFPKRKNGISKNSAPLKENLSNFHQKLK